MRGSGRTRRSIGAGVPALVVGALAALSCSSSEPGDAAPSPSTAFGESTEAFCAVVSDLPNDVPESYVGSARHVADLERLVAAAPPAVAEHAEGFQAYVASGSITEDPDTKDIENYPPAVRADVDALRAFVDLHCQGG